MAWVLGEYPTDETTGRVIEVCTMRTILIAVDVDRDSDWEGESGPWRILSVRSTIWDGDMHPTQNLDLLGLGSGQSEVESVEGPSIYGEPVYDIPLPDAETRTEQTHGLSLQMGYW